ANLAGAVAWGRGKAMRLQRGIGERREPRRLCRYFVLRARQMAPCRQAFGQPVWIAIKAQSRFERGDTYLVQPRRPLQRIGGDGDDEVLAPDDEAGLRTTEQLVAGEGDEVRALGDRLGDGRLAAQAKACQIDQRAGAEIVDQRYAGLARQFRQLRRG